MESQSPYLRWRTYVQHNTQHLLLPSLGPGMQHLANKTVKGIKQRKVANHFLRWVRVPTTFHHCLIFLDHLL